MKTTTDLDWLLEPGTKGSQEKAKAKADAAAKRAAALQRAKDAFQAQHYPQADTLLPWIPQARIFILFKSHCVSCGEEAILPEVFPQGIPQTRLVRFRHKHTGQIWEKPCLIREIPTSLSREVRYINASHQHCAKCLNALLAQEHGQQALPLEFQQETIQ